MGNLSSVSECPVSIRRHGSGLPYFHSIINGFGKIITELIATSIPVREFRHLEHVMWQPAKWSAFERLPLWTRANRDCNRRAFCICFYTTANSRQSVRHYRHSQVRRESFYACAKYVVTKLISAVIMLPCGHY